MNNMKKLFALLIALALGCLFALAEPAPETEETAMPAFFTLEGKIAEIGEDGSLTLECADLGAVLVLTDADTVWETMGDIAPGAYVHVDYDGKMTRSLPPQVTAQRVRMYVLSGDVLEYNAEENTVLIDTPSHGQVQVNLAEPLPEGAHAQLTVYFDGAMTMSLPPQIGADLILADE